MATPMERHSGHGIAPPRHHIFLLLVMSMCFLLQLLSQTVHIDLIQPYHSVGENDMAIPSVAKSYNNKTESNFLAKQDDNDWFDREVWESHSITKDSCFSLEGVCHKGTKWFYDSRLHENVSAYQPKPFYISNEATLVPEGYFPKTFLIRSQVEGVSTATCRYSPIPHHLVLHGYFSAMLGEFFARALAGLSEIYHKVLKTDKQRNLFVDTTQLYLQINKKKRHLLEGHEMFLSLFSRHLTLSYAGLLDSSHIMHCQCFKRLTFCGYERAKDRRIKSHKPNSLTLVPSVIAMDQDAKKPDYQQLQHLIYQKFVAHNPEIQDGIYAWRKNVLRGAKYQDSWTLVGLAQRKGRRRWMNMTQALKQCNTWGSPQKVRCVEVNVELDHMENPYQHVLAHASLDALIGIHGAQLTDGVLMKPGSVLVELLPFVPSKKDDWGVWTTFAHRPTPIGDMFHNTDLNHIGVPLTIDSMPNNTCATKESYTAQCFEKVENKWSERDFHFDGKAVIDVLERLVIPMTTKQLQWKRLQENATGINSVYDLKPESHPCNDLMERAGDDYVLYNIHCVDDANKRGNTVHHFYRDTEWLFNKTVQVPL